MTLLFTMPGVAGTTVAIIGQPVPQLFIVGAQGCNGIPEFL